MADIVTSRSAADDHEAAYGDQDAVEGHDVVCAEEPDGALPGLEHEVFVVLKYFL